MFRFYALALGRFCIGGPAMLAWEEWCRFGLRRPFSRRLSVDIDSVLEPTKHQAFVRALGPVQPENALAASLSFLGRVFCGQYAEAEAQLGGMRQSALAERYADLFSRTDLRKFVLSCFREHYHRRGMLTDEAAALLESFVRAFDRNVAELAPLDGTGPSATSASLMSFAKISTLPRAFKVTLISKKYYYDDRSRLHDLGPRVASAFAQLGLDCIVIDPRYETHDFAPADLILADDRYLHGQVFKKKPQEKARFLERLRASTPRLALFELDPWATSFADELAKPGQPYDFVWTLAPGLVRDGKINNVPACVVPFPVGFPELFAEARARVPASANDPIRFCGGVEEYNSPRLAWLLARHRFRLPFSYEITRHDNDHQPVAESLRRYLARLTATPVCLNFTRRANGVSMVVGRSFDVLCAGRVLLEELSNDIQYYLTPDEHFLAFRTVAELEVMCSGLGDRARIDEVARRGSEYFNAHYSDAAVLRHLLTFV